MMKKYRLEIKLLSDLCVADGGVYNSMLDTDICHDDYGLPYIPGKRIKGCLRECALELQDWGEPELLKNGKTDPIEVIFGKQGELKNRSAVRIGDARLEGDRELIAEINSGNAVLYHPQNVLGQYSYVRTMTSIDPETGVAKNNSLRTMRVVNRGCRFIAEVESEEKVPEKLLTDICRCLRNIGIARTRGLGEVECELIRITDPSSIPGKTENSDAAEHLDQRPNEEAAYNNESLLRYEIELQEPVICKSVQGGEAKSIDYIEGSKIIGLLSEELHSAGKLKEYLDGGVRFSNAYITSDGIRAAASGAYLYSIKNNDESYINKLYFVEKDDDPRQFSAIRNTYVIMQKDGGMITVPVRMEERYHHSRPSDKSIGRATDTDESKFYQISSISRGQTFAGFVSGTPTQLKEIFEILKDTKQCYIGYGKGSEYGKCLFRIRGDGTTDPPMKKVKGRQFVVKLNSPAIVYNENAMYTTRKQDLLKEILAALDLKELKENRDVEASYYINYVSVGGYNVTWDARKPMIRAFDKGTSVKLVFKEEQEITISSYMYLGERTAEGYGEFVCEELSEVQTEEQWKYCDDKGPGGPSPDTRSRIGDLGKKIYVSLLDGYIQEKAAELVRKNRLYEESYRPTVSNMLMICSEQNTIDGIETAVKDRFSKNSVNKKDKSQKANKIIKVVKDNYRGIEAKLSEEMNVDGRECIKGDELCKKLLVQVLIESKYQIRKKALASGRKGEADHE